LENFRQVRFVLIYTMLLNVAVTVAKIAVGYLTSSLSILADGLDSLFDSLSNVLGLAAIYLARRPPDEDHPYGHRRYEIMMTLIVSVLLFATTFELLRSAYQRFLKPVTPQITVWSYGSLLASIVLHVFVARYEKQRGKELRSEFLLADASHTQAGLLVSVGVLLGLVVMRMGYPVVDTILAVVISGFIARIGIDIIRSATHVLTDSIAVQAERVADIVRNVPGVTSFHHIRSRGQEDDIHLDLHVRVAPDMPLAQAHLIAHQVERSIQSAVAGARDVVVHVEPQPTASALTSGDVVERVRGTARATGTTIHHLNAHEIEGKYYIDLHLEVAGEPSLAEAHAQASALEERIKKEIPDVGGVTTHIEPFATHAVDCGTLDESRVVAVVRDLIAPTAGLRGCHDIQVYRVESQAFLTLHCAIDQNLSISQAHDIATVLEDRLRRACTNLAEVSIHMEPTT